jgi:hypothetical protein
MSLGLKVKFQLLTKVSPEFREEPKIFLTTGGDVRRIKSTFQSKQLETRHLVTYESGRRGRLLSRIRAITKFEDD